MIGAFVKKIAAFPFRQQTGCLIGGFSWITLLHLWLRWLSCPFEKFLKFIPEQGKIYDFGCGHGLMLQALDRVLPPSVSLLGVDVDVRKIRCAQRLNRSARVRYEVIDLINDTTQYHATCIILNDVLHLLPWANQIDLIRRCFRSILPGGVLLVKEINTSVRWKYAWTAFQEALVNHVFGLTHGRGLYYRQQDSWSILFKEAGFQVDVVSADKGYFYPHVIYCCRKIE